MANLPSRFPAYLTQNRVGTYVFQIRIPIELQRNHPSIKPVFRCSLRTKDRSEALRRSRPLWLMLDQAISDFSNPHSFDLQLQQIKQLAKNPGKPSGLMGVQSEVFHEVQPEVEENDLPLQLLVDRFMQHKKDTGSRAASLKWYGQKVQQFANVMRALVQSDRVCVSELTTDLVRNYATVMQRYPKHALIRKHTRELSEAQRVQLVLENDRAALQEMGIEPIGFQTVSHHFTAVRELLRYAEQQQYPIVSGLTVMIPAMKRKRGKKPQVKFSIDDLKTMFGSREYRDGLFDQPSDYWIPLLALFGGQTQAELCQLHVSDIRYAHGVWYMDINDLHEKLLKTESGRPRQVPLHNQLVELGFLKFVQRCRKNGQIRLFPSEQRDKNDKFSSYSKRFNRWRKRLGVTTDTNGGRKTFHSFRHLVSDWLVGNQCHPGVAADIIGHEARERTETRRTYSDGAWLQHKNEWIQRINYGLYWP